MSLHLYRILAYTALCFLVIGASIGISAIVYYVGGIFLGGDL